MTGAFLYYTNTRDKVKDGRVGKQLSINQTNHELPTVTYELNNLESVFYFGDMPQIATLTWFCGDFRAAKPLLEKRMKQIVAKNPWIKGRVSVSSYLRGTCNLSCTKRSHSDDVTNYEDINVDENLNVMDPLDSPISFDMPVELQHKAALKSRLFKSVIYINNGPKEPIFKASIVPCSNKPYEMFALVVQLSHVVGDGATYYKLMNMLCSTENDDEKKHKNEEPIIVELIPERIDKSVDLQIAAMGKAEANLWQSFGFTCLNILDMVVKGWKGTLSYDYSFINSTEKIEGIKISAAKEANLPFVSTNDVLTSWILQNVNNEYGLMAINWRNRLDGHTDLHVGNYENVITYRKDDFATPGLIRKSLASHKRSITGQKQFPSWWKVATSKWTLVTNWTTFAKPNEIEGCQEELHFPLTLMDLFPCHRLKCVVIFRAREGKIGLFYPANSIATGTKDPFGLSKK